MKKMVKPVLLAVAFLFILMTATGHMVAAAGADWSDGTSGNAHKKVYSISFRSGSGASAAVYKKMEKKQRYGARITIPKVPQVPSGYQAEGWSLKKGGSKAVYKPGEKYLVKSNVMFYAVIKKKNYPKMILHRNNGDVYKVIQVPGGKLKLPVMANESNYTFLGWSTRAGQKTSPRYEAGQVITVSGTMHLYEVRFWRMQEPNLVRRNFHYPTDYDRVIFVGDSRTYGLQNVLYEQFGQNYVDSHVSFVCCSNTELDWLKSTGTPALLEEIEKYRKDGKYAKIAVVFNHGVNDLRYIDGKLDLNDKISQYSSYMRSLGTKLSRKNCSLYYMSVNPINGGVQGNTMYRKCEDIRTFNSALAGKLGSQYHYIDVYSYLMNTGYGTLSNTGNGVDDGVHYTPKTYKRIFAYCLANIGKTGNYFEIEDIGS